MTEPKEKRGRGRPKLPPPVTEPIKRGRGRPRNDGPKKSDWLLTVLRDFTGVELDRKRELITQVEAFVTEHWGPDKLTNAWYRQLPEGEKVVVQLTLEYLGAVIHERQVDLEEGHEG